MAETSVQGARCKSSGDRPNRGLQNRPPPLSPPRDHISALPDAVIHHIFSFLTIRDVVKTSVLSKRWRSTWTTTADLVFIGYSEHRRLRTLDFSSLVDSVLSQCSTSPPTVTVRRFHVIGFVCDEDDCPKVDLWLHFAVRRRVEHLRLWLSEQTMGVYTLPGILYGLSWLVRLDVAGCCFSLGATVSWPCLKVLSIDYAELSDDFLGRIFRGSPVLESLKLRGCWGVRNVTIDSLSLKKLVLKGRGTSYNSCVENLRAPNLLSLRVLQGTHADFRLDHVSSLVEAKLDLYVETDDGLSCSAGRDLLKELLEKLRNVPTITIGGWCLKVLSLLEMDGVPSPLSKHQNLILHAPVSQSDLPGIAYMLQSSQCLEKLVIRLIRFPKFVLDEESKARYTFDEDFLCSRKGSFECLAKHLKRVEIIGCEDSLGWKHVLALIKFLLGDALVLEKLIIKAELFPQYIPKHLQAVVLSKLLGVFRNVLSYRRASKIAEVIFDYPFELVSS
ncbi:putative F-box/LRR-repeat protein At3g18150 [Syzygium oleosum]|uniref:putative F-box/LRR-repeat protein At3g18150 n=1 Tax=Syzygium oleosum TaxID=219896 RepID=UPI0024BBB0E8|nr:putative F-box/LRR-repeat protein At3g18150 [Syzygium oleosum]